MEVIGFGALNIDNIYRVRCILEDGESLAREAGSFPGGSAANTIYGLSKLGINTGFIGAIGNDNQGKSLIRDFDKSGVETRYIIVKAKARTGKTLCFSNNLGKRSIYILPGSNNLLSIDDVNLSYINSAKYTIPQQLLSAANSGGCLTVIHNGHGTGHAGKRTRPRRRVARGGVPFFIHFSLTIFLNATNCDCSKVTYTNLHHHW
ncbi:MAG: carbohydrate kinase family protein [Candidatus Thorarchaeota archaeon]